MSQMRRVYTALVRLGRLVSDGGIGWSVFRLRAVKKTAFQWWEYDQQSNEGL